MTKEQAETKTYTKQEIPLKTKNSKRKLVMPEIVLEAVLKQRIRYEKCRNRRKNDFQDLDYIYCSIYGRPRTPGYLGIQLQKFLKENELPYITWHNLRYTYSTMLLEAGYDLKTVSLTLGHANVNTTADIYVDMQHVTRNQVLEIEPWETKFV